MGEDMANKALVFVRHIQQHLDEMDIQGNVCCKICGKDIDTIYEEEKDQETAENA